MVRAALIRAREALKLSRAELAKIIEIDWTVVFKVEEGIQDCRHDTMRRWVAALGPHGSFDLFLPPRNATPRVLRERGDQGKGPRRRYVRRASIDQTATG